MKYAMYEPAVQMMQLLHKFIPLKWSLTAYLSLWRGQFSPLRLSEIGSVVVMYRDRRHINHTPRLKYAWCGSTVHMIPFLYQSIPFEWPLTAYLPPRRDQIHQWSCQELGRVMAMCEDNRRIRHTLRLNILGMGPMFIYNHSYTVCGLY